MQELKKSNRALVLWGGAMLADITYSYLIKNNIKVDAVAVSKKYHVPNHRIGSNDVVVLEDYVMENPGCNVLVAFSGYEEESIVNYRKYIHNVYCCELAGAIIYGWFIDEYYLSTHKTDLDWLRNELADAESKKALDDFIYQKSTCIYEKVYTGDMFFDEKIIQLNRDEIFFDCGAFTGDTIEDFITHLKKRGIKQYKKIYAIEPDDTNFQKAKENLKNYKNIQLLKKGVWDATGTLTFSQNASLISSISSDGEDAIEVDTIDSIVGNEKVTYIKMDIEGAELNALRGAENTIRTNKPNLGICIYHKPEDLYKIPRYIKSIVPEYKLYLRNHLPTATDSVLYAVI